MNIPTPSLTATRRGPYLSQIARALGAALLRSLILLTLAITGLAVILLPLTTLVPAPVWITLALAEAALVVALFWFKRAPLAVAGTLAGSAGVLALAVFASQAYAGTPPITDAQGRPLGNSIATLEKVTLNGSEQWITLRGQDVDNPVLLNLGMGGPGGGGFATRTLFTPLEEHFVVVSWDEPGTGKSYSAVPPAALTPERFVEDAHALTQLLRERFHEDKIYVYGTSWTSILGIWLVQRYPELYHAYLGNAQMVNTTENDVLGYELALQYLAERGETAAAEGLRRNGPPPYAGPGMLDKYVAYLDVLNDYMDAPRYTLVVPIVPFLAPEYGLIDRVNHTRGLIESFQVVYPQLKDLDFIRQAPRLEVPVYFFVGREDVNAMAALVERYHTVLQAPRNELIWLEGGHGLTGDNRDHFTDVVVNTILPQTYPH
ncbi:MAG: alpha/beta hydrolase [Anaerolineales bacterium]|nr:alpha/beta hydrolase [Anaerolineales bacterium]